MLCNLQLWDVRTRKLKVDLPGHADEVGPRACDDAMTQWDRLCKGMIIARGGCNCLPAARGQKGWGASPFKGVGRRLSGILHKSWSDPFGLVC